MSVNWQKKERVWWNLHIRPHTKISSHLVCSVFFKDSSKNQCQVRQYPETAWFTFFLVLWHTHRLRQQGQRKPQFLIICFLCKKKKRKKKRERKRGCKRQTIHSNKKKEKKIFCSLKSPTTLDKKPLFSYMRLDCTIWDHEWQFHSKNCGPAEVLDDSFLNSQ